MLCLGGRKFKKGGQDTRALVRGVWGGGGMGVSLGSCMPVPPAGLFAYSYLLYMRVLGVAIQAQQQQQQQRDMRDIYL